MSHFGADSGPRFELGRTMITRGALAALSNDEILFALRRHHTGDWGDLDDQDAACNEVALETGERLLSVYTSRTHERFYVITEWDRSQTTVLLPHEY